MTTYSLRVEDFVELESNQTGLELQELIKICKRHANPNRDYLFVNALQGKHLPAKAKRTVALFHDLYEKVIAALPAGERVMVVAFAETATAIGQAIMQFARAEKGFDAVYYVQTTREDLETSYKNLAFEEEHSHAKQQKLYVPESLPAFDRVLFVEDEITTGKTILNFIDKFREINPEARYAVASILNWQNSQNRAVFEAEGIERIALVTGKLKESLPTIDVKEEVFPQADVETDASNDLRLEATGNPRQGLDAHEFDGYLEIAMTLPTREDLEIPKDAWVEVIGTEENMWLPILLADKLEARVRATTRSPIAISKDSGYAISNGMAFPSIYEAARATYLYEVEAGLSGKVYTVFYLEGPHPQVEAWIREHYPSDRLRIVYMGEKV